MGLIISGRQEIHTAQPIGPEVNAFEVEMVAETVKSHITRY
jgi:hypothetical protein